MNDRWRVWRANPDWDPGMTLSTRFPWKVLSPPDPCDPDRSMAMHSHWETWRDAYSVADALARDPEDEATWRLVADQRQRVYNTMNRRRP